MRRLRSRAASLLLLLAAFSGAAHADASLRGGWREVRAGDTPAKVLHEYMQGRLLAFDPATLQRFRAGDRGSWIVIAPQPPWVTEQRVLSIAPPSFNTVTVYQSQAPVASLTLDDFTMPHHGHGRLAYHYPSTLEGSALLLLKLEPAAVSTVSMRFRLQPEDDFRRGDARWMVFATACLSVMLTMALMALCFALMLRDATFAWYAAYIFCFATIQGVQTGFLFHPLRWEWLAGEGPLIASGGIALSAAFAALFTARFCDIARTAPMLRVPVLALGVAMPLIVLLRASQVASLMDVAQLLLNPLLILGTALLLLASVTAALRGTRTAWFFLAGWTPLLVLSALSSAQNGGLLPTADWLDDGSLVAGAFEAMVLSLGLADRALTLRRDRDEVRILADNDPLTGVFNRRAWNAHALRAFERRADHPMALLFMDLDNFKLLNDRQGHAAGDRALVAAAKALGTELRPRDLFGRYGGEEFVALLDGVEQAQAMHIATRLCRRIHRLDIPVDGANLLLSISIGVAMRTGDDTLEALIEHADQAMYQAKLDGRNRAELFQPVSSASPPLRRLRSVQRDS